MSQRYWFPQRLAFQRRWHLPKIHCIMCRRIVVEIKDFACRHYGLLQYCYHTFCLQCIRQFNITQLVYTRPDFREFIPGCPIIICPVCGVLSESIVASSVFTTDPYEKAAKFAAYKKFMQSMSCRYLQHGIGECLCPEQNHIFSFRALLEMEDKNRRYKNGQ